MSNNYPFDLHLGFTTFVVETDTYGNIEYFCVAEVCDYELDEDRSFELYADPFDKEEQGHEPWWRIIQKTFMDGAVVVQSASHLGLIFSALKEHDALPYTQDLHVFSAEQILSFKDYYDIIKKHKGCDNLAPYIAQAVLNRKYLPSPLSMPFEKVPTSSQDVIQVKIDDDLKAYVSQKGDPVRFINFCIRERKDVIEKDYRKPIAMPSAVKAKREIEREYKKMAAEKLIADRTTPFYRQNVIITGTFDKFSVRNDLAAALWHRGAVIKGSKVTGKTNIVVLGKGAGPRKLEDIKELQASGIPLRVITEEELYNILHL